MLSSVLATTGWAARKTLVAGSLAFIGLLVGVGCVLLPAGVPFGIVGLAGLILLWTMPDLRSVPSRLARWAFVPFLFTSLCVPFYIAIVIPGVPFISLRRIFLYLFVGALVITISASSRHRAILMERLKTAPVLLFMTAGYYALIVGTLPLSVTPSATLNLIVQYTMIWYLPLLAVVLFVEKEEDIISIFRLLILCLIVDFVLGAIEFYNQRPFLFNMLPAGTRSYIVTNYPMYAGMETGTFRNGVYRATSIYNIGLSWSEMVTMVAPVAAYFVVHGKSWGNRLLGLAAFVAGFESLVYSGSRGGYVCSIAALSTYLLFWAIRKARLNPESLSGGIAIFLCSTAVAITLAAITFVNKFHIMVFGNGATQASNMGREAEWAKAWPAIYRSPIWGHGFGTAGDVADFSTGHGQGSLDDYRINLLLDNGFLGFALFFAMLTVAIWICLRIYISQRSPIGAFGAAIACALVAYAIDRTTMSQTENNTLMFVYIGLTFALDRLSVFKTGNKNTFVPPMEYDSEKSVPLPNRNLTMVYR